MHEKLSRRSLMVASLALFLPGCRTRGSASAGPAPAPRPVALPAPRSSSIGQWYEVAPGDTLIGISRRSGVPLQQIVDGNGGIRSAELRSGVRLWLPGATPEQAQAVVAGRIRPDEAVPTDDENEQAAGPGFILVPRSAWTKEPIGANRRPMNGVTRITVHHTGEHAGLANLPEAEVLRRIERYHRNERRWCAIGYHYIVGKDGRVYEGRPAKWQGAHVLSENEHNIGISVAGDFMRNLPNARQLRALESFLDDQRRRYHVAKKRVYGHRDLNRSLCPGQALYTWLSGYKSA